MDEEGHFFLLTNSRVSSALRGELKEVELLIDKEERFE